MCADAVETSWNQFMLTGEQLIPRLAELYDTIDSTYKAVIDQAGFSCAGCDGVKCCTVDLVLHTSIEMLYLRRGFNTLESPIRAEIAQRSDQIVRYKRQNSVGEEYRSAVCAANFDGLCSLYQHRPMICRLAGIPHIIFRPDGRAIESGGCTRYEQDVRPGCPDLQVDRTPFYRKLAQMEMEMIEARGSRTSARTVAEVLSGNTEHFIF